LVALDKVQVKWAVRSVDVPELAKGAILALRPTGLLRVLGYLYKHLREGIKSAASTRIGRLGANACGQTRIPDIDTADERSSVANAGSGYFHPTLAWLLPDVNTAASF
jgi:hypothetical protein